MVVPCSIFGSHFCVVCLSNKPKYVVVKQAHLMVKMTKNQNLPYIRINGRVVSAIWWPILASKSFFLCTDLCTYKEVFQEV